MPKTQIRGAQIHFDLTGEGSPLVLTAGQGTGPWAREALIAGLARRHTVLTYDQRGTGRSDRGPQGQSMAELAEDIAALMHVAGFSTADVLGHSTGSGKATALAANHPDRVRRLVLAAPWTHGDDYLHVVQELRKAAARTMPADHYTQLNSLLIYPPEYRREKAATFARLAAESLDRPQDAAGIAARLDAILAFDARPLYSKITCPTLVMGARDDQVMPVWFAREAAASMKQSRLVEYERGGHMFPETRTDDFVRDVLEFLE